MYIIRLNDRIKEEKLISFFFLNNLHKHTFWSNFLLKLTKTNTLNKSFIFLHPRFIHDMTYKQPASKMVSE